MHSVIAHSLKANFAEVEYTYAVEYLGWALIWGGGLKPGFFNGTLFRW